MAQFRIWGSVNRQMTLVIIISLRLEVYFQCPGTPTMKGGGGTCQPRVCTEMSAGTSRHKWTICAKQVGGVLHMRRARRCEAHTSSLGPPRVPDPPHGVASGARRLGWRLRRGGRWRWRVGLLAWRALRCKRPLGLGCDAGVRANSMHLSPTRTHRHQHLCVPDSSIHL